MIKRVAPVVAALCAVPLVILLAHLLAGSRQPIVHLDLGQVEAAASLLVSISDSLTTIAVSLILACAVTLGLARGRRIGVATILLAGMGAACALASIFFGYRMKVDLAPLLLADKQDGVPMEELRHILRLLRMHGMALVCSASFVAATVVQQFVERARRPTG